MKKYNIDTSWIKDKKWWLEHQYPCTIIKDRYTGAYSGGEWTCWPCDENKIPKEQRGDDITCMDFWNIVDKSIIGIGNSPQEALGNLVKKLLLKEKF